MSTRENELNRILSELGQNALQMAMWRQEHTLDQERVGLERTRTEQEAERIALATEQQGMERRAQAMQRVLQFAPFIKPDSTIAENAFIHDEIKEAFGEDPTDPNGIGGLVFNEQTWEQILKPYYVNILAEMPEAERNAILSRGFNRAVIGTPASTDELELQGSITSLRLRALDEFKEDPIALTTLARQSLGMDPITRVSTPDGRIIEFDTTAAASLSVQMWSHQKSLDQQLSLANLDKEAQIDMAGELMDQMKAIGQIISRPRAMEIIRAVHSDKPQEAVAELQERYAGSPELKAALTMYLQGADIAESAIPEFIRTSAPELVPFFQLSQMIGETLGAEAAAKILPEINKILYQRGAGTPRPAGKFSFWRQSGISPNIERPLPTGRGGTDTTQGGLGGSTTPGGTPLGDSSIAAPVTGGKRDLAALAQNMRSAAARYKAGELSLAQVKAMFPDRQDYLTVIKYAQQMPSGPRR